MEQKCETHKTDLCKCYEDYCRQASMANCLDGTIKDHKSKEVLHDHKLQLMSNAIESMFKCGLNFRKEIAAEFAKNERLIAELRNELNVIRGT